MNTYKTPSLQQARGVQALLDECEPVGVEVAYLPAVEGWAQWDAAVRLQDVQEAAHADHSKG